MIPNWAFDDVSRYVEAAQQTGGSCANYDVFTDIFGAQMHEQLLFLEHFGKPSPSHCCRKAPTKEYLMNPQHILPPFILLCCSMHLQISWAKYHLNFSFPKFPERHGAKEIWTPPLDSKLCRFMRHHLGDHGWLGGADYFHLGIRLVRLVIPRGLSELWFWGFARRISLVYTSIAILRLFIEIPYSKAEVACSTDKVQTSWLDKSALQDLR